MQANRIASVTRVMHICMIVTVAFQLISSLLMMVPEPGKLATYKTTLFTLHIMLFGWGAFVVSGVYAATRFGEKGAWGKLVPWFSKKHLGAFFKSAKEELPGVFTGNLARPESSGALAGAMHGLGFLTLIALGMTGAYVMNGVRSDGSMKEDMVFMFELHELFGVVIWTFLVCHVFMVIYHLMLGHKRIFDIFERLNIKWK
ncbi:MAG: cytochrome b/b6 domain-containing protein [Mariprofundaceae bacterium]